MNLKASEILEHFKGQGLIFDHIGPDNRIERFAPIDDFAAGDLVFVDTTLLSWSRKQYTTVRIYGVPQVITFFIH